MTTTTVYARITYGEKTQTVALFPGLETSELVSLLKIVFNISNDDTVAGIITEEVVIPISLIGRNPSIIPPSVCCQLLVHSASEKKNNAEKEKRELLASENPGKEEAVVEKQSKGTYITNINKKIFLEGFYEDFSDLVHTFKKEFKIMISEEFARGENNRRKELLFLSETSPSAPVNVFSYAEEILKRKNLTLDSIEDYNCEDNFDNYTEFVKEDNDIRELANVKYGDEYYFNADIFPIFERIFNKEFGFEKEQFSKFIYNSESYQWLPEDENSKHKNKPDGFICYSSFYEFRKVPEIASANSAIKYGVPNKHCISLIHGVLEAKSGRGPITFAELGKLFKYLYLLSKQGHPFPRGVLYNQTNIIFAQFDERGNCIEIYKRLWSQPGCSRCLEHFFSNGCNPIADDIVKHFYNQHYRSEKVLGKGKYGLVFQVKKDQKQFAVKCVMEGSNFFKEEYNRLIELKETGLFVEVVEGSLFLSDKINSYAMSEVGSPIDINNFDKKTKKSIVKCLHELHLIGLTHGDPRIPNIVICARGVLKWIDVRHNNNNDVENDVVILWKSITNQKEFDEGKKNLLDSYCNDKDLKTLESIFFK